MAVKTKFSKNDLVKILSNYNLGEYKNVTPFTGGTVQTNLLMETTKGKFVFRYYENRSKDSVLFESNLMKYLKDRKYPCPAPFRNKKGKFVTIYNKKPCVFFEFIAGQHIETPDENQKKQIIKKVAQLQNLTRNYKPFNKKYRWNYSIELCRNLAQKEARKIDTVNSMEKLKWLENELLKLNLPKSLPKGICHCDFHFSNVLFKNNEFNALLDFDDANYTFLMFDLVSLIDSWAWPHNKTLNFKELRKILTEYTNYRSLNSNEKKHLYDLHKLQILIDCVWFFERGNVKDFYEKRKIDYLNNMGRENFYHELFA
jgi:homoserine kinase